MGESDHQPPRFPRLGTSDFLVLTLCVSFVFALSAHEFQDGYRLYVIKWHQILPDLLDSLVVGLSLFGLIVLARQRLRGTIAVLAPGHLFITSIGPFKVFALIFGVFQPIWMEYWSRRREHFMAAVDVACALVFLASAVFPMLTFRTLPRSWRICMAFVLLILGMNAAWCFLDATTNLGLQGRTSSRHLLVMIGNAEAALMAATFTAVGTDAYRRLSRDWLHHLGCGTVIISAAAALMHWHALMAGWWRDLLLHLYA